MDGLRRRILLSRHLWGLRRSPTGFSDERIRAANEKLKDALLRLEHRLESRPYLVGEYTLADIAHAGNSHRLRELAERGDVSLRRYRNVTAYMERMESRESYEASA